MIDQLVYDLYSIIEIVYYYNDNVIIRSLRGVSLYYVAVCLLVACIIILFNVLIDALMALVKFVQKFLLQRKTK